MCQTTRVLVVCTANICRSAMAEALLARKLAAARVPACVRSAGLLPGGEPPPAEVAAAAAAFGVDVAGHRSRELTPGDLGDADIVLAMARIQVRHAVVADPAAWPRTFTLKELVRRGARVGPRAPGERVAAWLARAHAGRDRARLLGDCPDDDVADPFGGAPEEYKTTAGVLDEFLSRLLALCWPEHTRASEPGPSC